MMKRALSISIVAENFTLDWHCSGFWCDPQNNPVQIIGPYYLASKSGVRLHFAPFTLECGNLKIRPLLELAEPRLLNENVAGSTLT